MKIGKTSDYNFFNSYGGFTNKGDEYHILNTNTPLPWCNVMANENFGTIISSYGTVYTYYLNSREFKLTDWCNDWVEFKPGEEFKGIFSNNYNLVYGYGYTRVIEEEDYITKTMDIFIPKEDNVKIQYIKLENTYGEEKEIEIEYKLNPTLGVTRETNLGFILSKIDNNTMILKNPYSIDFSNCEAFEFVVSGSNNIQYHFNSDEYSLCIKIKVMPNSFEEFAIILGACETSQYIKEIKEKYNSINAIQDEYLNTKKYWRKLVIPKDKFNTGDKYTDIMANGWLLYQTIVCRLYARSGFYQSGGAIGFRDQLQDTLSLISSSPDMTRKQIVLNSSKQFEKGDVLHWWHEHNNAGIRTYFSDDYLWLPYVLTEYINKTKDYSILDVKTKYLEDKYMGNQRELYDVFHNINIDDSVYNHAKKAIMYGLSRKSNQNGLLDIGDGDWNDGFSNIRGQSVWLTFFMMNVLDRFESIAKYMNDKKMVDTCKKERHLLKHSIIDNCWDTDHFVRAYFENGEVLGAYSNKECKLDLISQSWAVISMINDKDVKNELETCMEAAYKYLVDKENMVVRLLYPPFDKPKNNPGYIKAYVPGTRENGGQYTHAATWFAKAYFELNNKEKGMKILKYINPIYHSDTKEKADKYMVEPYVIAADIYSNPDHPGRGGWTWYTGSSSWMYKVIEDYLKK